MNRFLLLASSACCAMFACGSAHPVVTIDAAHPGKVLPNTSQTLTVWDGAATDWSVPQDPAYPTDFVEYVELMACTGGNAKRDLFKALDDRTVLDDYDFGKLVGACRGILAQGAKPYLKLGNVPMKFSSDYDGGEFATNVRPPSDHLVHYRYMRAVAAELKARFGRDEVRTWRFSVLTEADNVGWFRAKSGDKAEIREEFFKLYDYTAKAFGEELGDGLVFGTHLLSPAATFLSQFSAEDVIEHCARGTNFATGGIGAPLRLLTISYYGVPDHDDLGLGCMREMKHVIDAARAAGFSNLISGVDEGRVLSARSGRDRNALLSRAVGQSYEAAFDVRVVRDILDAGADYFATWGYFTGPCAIREGVPSHHYFSCRELARLAGMRRAETKVSGTIPKHEELDAIAGVSSDGRTVRVAVGRFRDKLAFTNRLEAAVAVRLSPALAGRTVRVETLTLDDRNNWFGDWERDRVRHGIGDKDFSWSPDDFAVLAGKELVTERFCELFAEELQPAYAQKAAAVRPVRSEQKVGADGVLALTLDFVGNGAAHVVVKIAP